MLIINWSFCLFPRERRGEVLEGAEVGRDENFGKAEGGGTQLHKPNPSTTGPAVLPDEITACGSDGFDLFE